jgi:hypothetical protein
MASDYGRLFRSRCRRALRPLTGLTTTRLLCCRGLGGRRGLLGTLTAAGALSPTLTFRALREQSERKQKGCEHD